MGALPANDGRSLYVASSTSLIRYDLVASRVTAAVPTPSTGGLALADNGTLVLADSGIGFSAPGSGLVYIFGPDLELQGTVDMSTPLGGRPHGPEAIRTLSVAIDRKRSWAYVVAGTPSIGPPAQPDRVLIIDLPNKTLVRAIDVSRYGKGIVLPHPGCPSELD